MKLPSTVLPYVIISVMALVMLFAFFFQAVHAAEVSAAADLRAEVAPGAEVAAGPTVTVNGRSLEVDQSARRIRSLLLDPAQCQDLMTRTRIMIEKLMIEWGAICI